LVRPARDSVKQAICCAAIARAFSGIAATGRGQPHSPRTLRRSLDEAVDEATLSRFRTRDGECGKRFRKRMIGAHPRRDDLSPWRRIVAMARRLSGATSLLGSSAGSSAGHRRGKWPFLKLARVKEIFAKPNHRTARAEPKLAAALPVAIEVPRVVFAGTDDGVFYIASIRNVHGCIARLAAAQTIPVADSERRGTQPAVAAAALRNRSDVRGL
jgi:hypothetical protein